MNYYFLLEDEKSLLKVLPHLFQYLGFPCTRVADIKQVVENNYILQSGQGVTQLITKALFDTIDTLLDNPGRIDKLVILTDTEERSEEYRRKQIRFRKCKPDYVQSPEYFKAMRKRVRETNHIPSFCKFIDF